MVVKDDGSPVRVPPVVLEAAAASANSVAADGAAAGEGEEAPHTPQVSSKHWRKIRSAVVALAAFRSRRVSFQAAALFGCECELSFVLFSQASVPCQNNETRSQKKSMRKATRHPQRSCVHTGLL